MSSKSGSFEDEQQQQQPQPQEQQQQQQQQKSRARTLEYDEVDDTRTSTTTSSAPLASASEHMKQAATETSADDDETERNRKEGPFTAEELLSRLNAENKALIDGGSIFTPSPGMKLHKQGDGYAVYKRIDPFSEPVERFTKGQLEFARKVFSRGTTYRCSAYVLENIPKPVHFEHEVVLFGRSNAGKSSLLNHLCGYSRKKLARTSKTPGKTQAINFYHVNQSKVQIIDLPGYGYARAPKVLKRRTAKLAKYFLSTRKLVRRVFLLLDVRRGVTDVDMEYMTMMEELGVPYQLVLTKADKVYDDNVITRGLQDAQKIANLSDHCFPQVLLTSARDGTGLRELRAAIIASTPLYEEHRVKMSGGRNREIAAGFHTPPPPSAPLSDGASARILPPTLSLDADDDDDFLLEGGVEGDEGEGDVPQANWLEQILPAKSTTREGDIEYFGDGGARESRGGGGGVGSGDGGSGGRGDGVDESNYVVGEGRTISPPKE